MVDGVTALAALKAEALLVGNAKTSSRRGPRMESVIPSHLVLGQIPENLAGPLATTGNYIFKLVSTVLHKAPFGAKQ